jgi:protein phosphatase
VASGRVSVGVVCSVGIGADRGGRATNQDNYLVCRNGTVRWRAGEAEEVNDTVDRPEVLLAVADGMGGHEDGEIAASAAVQALSRLYARPLPATPEAELLAFLHDAHARVRERVKRDGEVKMGTTLTAAWLIGHQVYWAHVGDSRLYHWRGDRITRITRDQTREEFAMRDRRPMPSHPTFLAQNFIFGSRGLGQDEKLRLDRGLDTGAFTLRPGDRLLLSSDGLHGRLDDARIADTLSNVPAPQACAATLCDNITALVVRAEDEPVEAVDDADTIIPI